MKKILFTLLFATISLAYSEAAVVVKSSSEKEKPSQAYSTTSTTTLIGLDKSKSTSTAQEEEIPTHLDKASTTKLCEDVKSKIDDKIDILNSFTEEEKVKVNNVIDKLDKIKEIADKKLEDDDLVEDISDKQNNVDNLLIKFIEAEDTYSKKIYDIKSLSCITNLKDIKKKIEDSKSNHKDLVTTNKNLHNYISTDVKETLDKVKQGLDKNKTLLDKIKSLISGN